VRARLTFPDRTTSFEFGWNCSWRRVYCQVVALRFTYPAAGRQPQSVSTRLQAVVLNGWAGAAAAFVAKHCHAHVARGLFCSGGVELGNQFLAQNEPQLRIGHKIITECSQDKPGQAFYVHYYYKPKGKPREPFATCIYPLAFNRFVAICDDKGVFYAAINWNIAIEPGGKQTLQDEYDELQKACSNIDLSKTDDPVGAITKCINDYLQKKLKHRIKNTCNAEGILGKGDKPCIRQQQWPPPAKPQK
jgi:hypothetical protein